MGVMITLVYSSRIYKFCQRGLNNCLDGFFSKELFFVSGPTRACSVLKKGICQKGNVWVKERRYRRNETSECSTEGVKGFLARRDAAKTVVRDKKKQKAEHTTRRWISYIEIQKRGQQAHSSLVAAWMSSRCFARAPKSTGIPEATLRHLISISRRRPCRRLIEEMQKDASWLLSGTPDRPVIARQPVASSTQTPLTRGPI